MGALIAISLRSSTIHGLAHPREMLAWCLQGRLGAQGFWFDEGNTALLVHLSPGRMLVPH
jgi:hypothetical protein